MNKIISQLQITPDGFCNHEDVIDDERHLDFVFDLMDRTEAVLFGRKTYDLFRSYWPKAVHDKTLSPAVRKFAKDISTKKKIVFSKSNNNSDWENTFFLDTMDAAAVTVLKDNAEKDLLLFGSPYLTSQMMREGWIDDCYFFLQPILSGRGERLFENTYLRDIKRLRFVNSWVQPSGVVILHYQK